jgi:hypothetical protein
MTVLNRIMLILLVITGAVIGSANAAAQDDRGKQAGSLAVSQSFHARASQKAGLLIPLYNYPENIHTNESWNRVMDLKRTFAEVPFCKLYEGHRSVDWSGLRCSCLCDN